MKYAFAIIVIGLLGWIGLNLQLQENRAKAQADFAGYQNCLSMPGSNAADCAVLFNQ